MSKFNLFTLFLTVIIVVIVGEVLVNDYTDTPGLLESGRTDVMGTYDEDTNVQPQALKFDLDGQPTDSPDSHAEPRPVTPSADTAGQADSAGGELSETDSLKPVPHLSFGMIEQTGFNNVSLQRIPFSGILFERVDLRDFRSVPVIQQNLLQNNRSKVAEFYEFHSDSQLLANEIYLLIKEKIGTGPVASVNPSNEFGDGSYYINYPDRPDTAFLVVRITDSVYALTYRKELHSYIKSLLLLL